MSLTFTKLCSSITESTVWLEPAATRLVWITMLAMADKHGLVFGSVPGLAYKARVDLEDCRKALETLMSPDEDSRTKEHEGRRIAEVDGGWELLNHAKYREIQNVEAIKESKKNYMRRVRASNVHPVPHNSTVERVDIAPLHLNLSNPDTEGDAGGRAKKRRKRAPAVMTPLPGGFEPNATAIELAKSLGVNLAAELPQWKDHHLKLGSTFLDWQAALRTWVRNAPKFAPRAAPAKQQGKTVAQVMLEMGVRPK